MFEVSKFYPHKLHLLRFDYVDDEVKLCISNEEDDEIESIKVSFLGEEKNIEVKSSDKMLFLSCKANNINSYKEPIIISYIFQGKEIILDYSLEASYFVKPKSISSMGNEKFYYKNEVSKITGCKKSNIKYEAQNYGNYWNCVCGTSNMEKQDKCYNCSINKSVLFENKINCSKVEYGNRKSIESNVFLLVLMVPAFLIYLLYISLYLRGDFLFDNQLVDSPLGIFNISFGIIAIPFFTAGLIFAKKRYNKVLEISCSIARILALLYINFLTIVFSIGASYMFSFFIFFDAIMIWYFISKLYVGKDKKVNLSIVITTICLLMSGLVKTIIVSKNDVVVTNDGLSLVCHNNEKVFRVPETIDGVKVSEIRFPLIYNYDQIEELVLSKNVKRIAYSTTMILPNLKKITLENNKNFYIKKDILFYQNGKTALVPAQLEEVYVDWENVDNSQFFDCQNLKKVEISKDTKKIGEKAFMNCKSLTSFSIEEDSALEMVGAQAFSNCQSLKDFSLPDSVNYIGEFILEDCFSIKNITLPFIGEYRYEEDETSNKNYFGYTFSSIYRLDFLKWLDLESVTITSQRLLQNVSFYSCKAKKITINPCLGRIGVNSFYNSSIEEFVVPEGIDKISQRAFFNCKNLKKIVLPSSLKTVEKEAFSGCDLLNFVDYSLLNIDNVKISSEGNEVFIELINKV